MILMGDEVRRTQRGNNNAYCQDNEISWFDWTLLAKHADVHRFVSLLNARRVLRDVEHERQRVSLNEVIRQANNTWHGVKLDRPDWSPYSHSIAFTAKATRGPRVLPRHRQRVLGAPRVRAPADLDGGRHPWRRWIDTFLESPDDIVEWERAPVVRRPYLSRGAALRGGAVRFQDQRRGIRGRCFVAAEVHRCGSQSSGREEVRAHAAR